MVSTRVNRVSVVSLDGSFGPDRGRRIVVSFIPGKDGGADGPAVPDRLELRPLGTRRAESVTVLDVYRFAVRSRANAVAMDKLRARKAAKAERLARRRQARAEERLFSVHTDRKGGIEPS